MIASPTPPGFTMESPNMSLMFISAHQVALGSHNAEYVVGWKTVMKIMIDVFESEIDMDIIKTTISLLLGKWAEQGWMGRGKPIKLNLKISEEKFFPPPEGQMKQIKVQFFDQLATSVKFFIRRKFDKSLSMTLRHIALRQLSSLVDEVESVESLELPRDLRKELRSEMVSCWKSRYLAWLKNQREKRKSYSEDYNDKRHAWRAITFDDKDRFKLPF